MTVVRDVESTLVTLAYELLAAHSGTARLAAELAADPAWSEHLDYLHQLQRAGRETLAACADRRVG
jgi:hypothetical protein